MYGKLKEQTAERGFFSVDSEWRFKHVNKKAADLLGEDSHTLVGEVFWEEFPEAEGSVFENKTKEAVEEHRPVSFRWDYEPLDAEFCIQAHPSDGGLSVCFEDLTEANAKKKLERHGLESSQDVIWMFEPDFSDTLFVNSTYEEVIGQPRDALNENPTAFLEATHPDDREKLRENMDRISGGEPVDFEIRVNPREDYGRWVWLRGHPVYAGDEPVAVVGFTRDVTERKEREEELRKTKERLDLAVEGAELGVWDWNLEENEVNYDDRWAEMLGMSSGGTSGVRFRRENAHPEDLPEVNEELERHVAGETDRFEAEYRMRTAEGDWKWIRSVGQAVERGNDGTAKRVVGAHMDIDDRKEHERLLEWGNEVLDSLWRTSREMIDADSPEGVYEALEGFGSAVFEEAGFYVWEDGVLRCEQDCVSTDDDDPAWIAFSRAEKTLTICGDDSVTKSYEEADRGTDFEDADVVRIDVPVGNEGVLTVRAEETGYLLSRPLKRFLDSLVVSAETTLRRLEKESRLSETADELEEKNRQLRQVSEIDDVIRQLMKSVVEAEGKESIQEIVCENVLRVEGWDAVVLLKEDGEDVTVECSCGDEGFADVILSSLEGAPVSDSLDDDEVRTIDDVARAEKSAWRSAVLDNGYLSVATVPVRYGNRRFGVLEVYSSETGAFMGEYSDALVDAATVTGYAFTSVEQMRSIMSGGFDRFTLRLDADETDCFFSVLADELDTGVRINAVVPGGGKTTVYFNTEADGDDLRRVADDEGVELSETVNGYGAKVSGMSVVGQATELGGRVTRYASESGSLLVEVDLPQGTDARGLLDTISEEFPGAELAARKSSKSSEMRGSPLEDLTERQRTVLRLAHESGFFESPREKTGQDLADEMGITATTFHQHLRSAQKKMVRKILEVSD
jgi:PAS domain S-box-containing protein